MNLKMYMLNSLIRVTRQNIIVPLYHVISDVCPLHIRNLFYIRDTEDFINDIDFLLKYYHPVSLQELIEITKKGKPAGENICHLTFDDGLTEMESVVAPILKQKGVPATFFINTAFLDNKDIFFRYKASLILTRLQNTPLNKMEKKKICYLLTERVSGCKNLTKRILNVRYANRQILDEIASLLKIDFSVYLQNKKPYLSSGQVQNLLDMGFAIGAHSIDHPEYYMMNDNERIKQTKGSMEQLVQRFGLKYRAFAFPFTDYMVSKNFFDIVYDRDDPILDISFGTAGLKNDDFSRNIQRLPVEMTKLSLQKFVYQQYISYILKSLIGKHRIQRR